MEDQQIILLHGDMQNSTSLKKIQGFLDSEGHRTFTYDLPGHGNTSYTEETHHEILNNFIIKNNITNPILIGHSFGGSLALKHATENDNIKSMVLINSLATNLAELNISIENISKTSEQESSSKFQKQELINYQELSNSTDEEIKDVGIKTTLTKGYIKNFEIYKSLPPVKELAKIKNKILAIASIEDRIISKEYIKQYSSFIPNCKFELVNGGHNSPITNPQGIINAINKNYEFLLGQ